VSGEGEREAVVRPGTGGLAALVKARVVDPILGQLKQGVSPKAIALSVSLGGVLGLFPVIGATTVLCLGAAFALRLNHVVIQAVNYVVYPAQIVLLVPFMQAGQSLFAADTVPIGLEQLRAAFEAGWWQALAELWQLIVFGILAWSLAALPLAALVYLVCVPVLRRVRWVAVPQPE